MLNVTFENTILYVQKIYKDKSQVQYKNRDLYAFLLYEKKRAVRWRSPESEGVIAKSNWGSNTPAAIGMAITL